MKKEELIKKLPHGSGIDGEWYLEETKDKIYACNSFHVMDDYGYYVTWVDFCVVFPKKNPKNFKVKIKNNYYYARKYGLKEYLEDLIAESLGD